MKITTLTVTPAVAALLLAAAASGQADPPLYHIDLLGPASDVEDINASGEVVGGFIDPSRPDMRAYVAGPTHPYEWLPLPSGYARSWANGINDAGVIVGGVSITGYPNEHGDGAVWTPDGAGGYDVEVLGHLPGHTGSVATDVNNRGDIIGTSIFNNSGFGPAVWFNAPDGILNLQALGAPNAPQAINDNGLVVGYAEPPFDIDTRQPVPYPPGQLGGTATLSVNNNDELAGYVVASNQNTRFAVRYTHAFGWEQLGNSGNASSPISAYDINDDGVTVLEAPGVGVGVHFNEYGTLSLESRIPLDQGFWNFFSAQGEAINNAGQIAAMAVDMNTFESGVALLTPLGEMIIPGDVDGNAIVDLDDLCAWEQAPVDLNGDDVVDEADEQWLIDLLEDLGFVVGDCNGNGLTDHCEILDGLSPDCDGDGVPDECQPDCNGDGVPDACDPDCNGNGISDACDIADLTSLDCNENGIPDECDEGGVTEFMQVFDPPIFVAQDDTVTRDFVVNEIGLVDDVDFTIDIDYRIGYLIIRLSHGGRTVTLVDQPGHPEQYSGFGHVGYDIVLDDEGTGGPIESEGDYYSFEKILSPPSYTPDEALNHFDGLSVEGVWTVEVTTMPGYSPVNTFNDWGLTITRAGVPVDPCVPGDATGDGIVDVQDLVAVITSWGPCPPPPAACPADLDGSGSVDVNDLVMVILNWS